MSRARCFEWHSRFKSGRTSLEDDEKLGRSSTSTTKACLSFVGLRTVNSSPRDRLSMPFYCAVLRRLRENIRRKRPGLWCDGNWLLQQDNAPTHDALKTREFLRRTTTIVAPHPPYSPDLALCDFFLFPKIKFQLKGRRFDSVEEIQRETQMVHFDFQGAFQALQKHWERCIASQVGYFEEDSGKI